MIHLFGQQHRRQRSCREATEEYDNQQFTKIILPLTPSILEGKALRRYAEIAEYLGLPVKSSKKLSSDEAKVEALIAAVNDLKDKIGIKKTIKDYVPDEAEFLKTLDEMSENAFDDQCTGANPRYPLISEIKQMFLNAYYGKHEEV